MNMFARFDEILAMTLQDIKETKRYIRTDALTYTRTDNVKTVYPPQKSLRGYKEMKITSLLWLKAFYIP